MSDWVPMTSAIVERFRACFDQAVKARVPEPTAMILATVGEKSRPAARTVLLKDMDEHGFVFYTNLGSRKARHIAEHPEVSLVFWWRETFEQVLVEGIAEPVADAEADAYFATRPRGSQIGAWASIQSTELASREALNTRFTEIEQRFEGGEVPRPDFWSGYRVRPRRIEFWYGRESRLHERVCFELVEGEWRESLLYP